MRVAYVSKNFLMDYNTMETVSDKSRLIMSWVVVPYVCAWLLTGVDIHAASLLCVFELI